MRGADSTPLSASKISTDSRPQSRKATIRVVFSVARIRLAHGIIVTAFQFITRWQSQEAIRKAQHNQRHRRLPLPRHCDVERLTGFVVGYFLAASFFVR